MQEGIASADERLVQRQALAGMIWSKQFYYYDINRWLDGDPAQPPPPKERTTGRNADWRHLNNADVISMPDKWEYPWYAAWDLAFHCLPLAMVDAGFAKRQLLLMTREWYMHPSGQLPAYEWALGDVNPPVHAWASWRVFQIDRKQRGDIGDIRFLERVFHKLVINFTWWVNRKDIDGNNVFQGGFLGLDNIGLFDRSAPLPTGGHINQSDGTSWMAMYSLNLMRIALELAKHNDTYEDIASKFFEHFLLIAGAMMTAGEGGLWDEEDAFYYDWLEMSESAAPHAAAGAKHGRPDPAVRRRGARGRRARSPARLLQTDGMVPQLAQGPLRSGVALGSARRRPAPAVVAAARPADEGAAPAHARTRTSFSRRTASAPCRASISSTRSASSRTGRSLRFATRPASRKRMCSAATPTGAVRSGCR